MRALLAFNRLVISEADALMLAGASGLEFSF